VKKFIIIINNVKILKGGLNFILIKLEKTPAGTGVFSRLTRDIL